MDSSLTIRFDSAAVPPTPAEPVPRFGLSFAIDLDGVAAGSVEPGLSASLMIHFALQTILQHICERATFAGVIPIGHAPLVIDSASYIGSTCNYTDPATDPPLIVYLDDPTSQQVLKIGFPAANLWSFFQWPAPVIVYDPVIGATEQEPPIWFGIDSFADVQIPMRLEFEIPPDPLDPKPTTVTLREMTYDDAPFFSASDYSVTCSGQTNFPMPMEITGPEIAAALTTAGYEEGIYDLYWRIYRGAGDMIYRARCIEHDLGTKMDRIVAIGGGPGIEMDTEILAARVDAMYKPLPFFLTNADGNHNVGFNYNDDLTVRNPSTHSVGYNVWVGNVNSQSVALSWTGGNVYLGGRKLQYTFPSDTLCYALRVVDGVSEILYARSQQTAVQSTTATLAVQLWVRRYIYPSPTLTQIGGAVITVNRYSSIYGSFSPSCDTLSVFSSHYFSSIQGASRNGLVYSADITSGLSVMSIFDEGSHLFPVDHSLIDTSTGYSGDNANNSTYEHIEETVSVDWSIVVAPRWGNDGLLSSVRVPYQMTGAWTHAFERQQTTTISETGDDDYSCSGNVGYKLTFTRHTQVEERVTVNQDTSEVDIKINLIDVAYQDGVSGNTPSYTYDGNTYREWCSGSVKSSGYIYDESIRDYGELIINGTAKNREYRITQGIPFGLVAVDRGEITRNRINQNDWEITSTGGTTSVLLDGTVVMSVTRTSPDIFDSISGWKYPRQKVLDESEAEYNLAIQIIANQNINRAFSLSSSWVFVGSFDGDTLAHADFSDGLPAVTAINNDIINEPEIPVSSLMILSPFSCSLNPNLNLPLPSGDPIQPPLYTDLLEAVQAARAAAEVSSSVGDPIVSNLAGDVTYDETKLTCANPGVVLQDWTIVFTDALGHFRLDGHTLGEGVATGSISVTLAPNNLATNAPYFTLLSDGWSMTPPAGARMTFHTAPSPLSTENAMIEASALHCQWMADHSSLAELGINGSTPLQRAQATGSTATTVGEIRYRRGYQSLITSQALCEAVVDAWIADQDASAILLDPDWSLIGGYAVPAGGGSTDYIFCVMLGSVEVPP